MGPMQIVYDIVTGVTRGPRPCTELSSSDRTRQAALESLLRWALDGENLTRKAQTHTAVSNHLYQVRHAGHCTEQTTSSSRSTRAEAKRDIRLLWNICWLSAGTIVTMCC